MYDDMISQAQVSVDRMVTPAREFQSLMMDSAERATRFQIESTRSYFEMGLRNLRNGLAVSDASGLQSYLSAQQDLIKGVAEKLQNDLQSAVGMQQEFGQQVQKLFEQNVQSAAGPVASSKQTRSAGAGTRKSA